LTPGGDVSREMGLIIETTAITRESAMLLADALRVQLCRYYYPGRRGAGDNVVHPLSPAEISFRRTDGSFGTLIPLGTADLFVFEHLRRIEAAVVASVAAQMPHAFEFASHRITAVDASNPAVLVRTIDPDAERLLERHRAELDRITSRVKVKPGSLLNLEAPDAYEWSVYHVLQDEEMMHEEMFPITHYRADGQTWTSQRVCRPAYNECAEVDPECNVDPLTLSAIDDVEPEGESIGSVRLADMTSTIRSKNVGAGLLTFDLVFKSGESYEAALYSNVFFRVNMARQLRVPPERMIGTYFVDSCNAIKITIYRPFIAGDPHDCDLSGDQQQMDLEQLRIPIYARSLVRSASN
jgi:hypothetical protein